MKCPTDRHEMIRREEMIGSDAEYYVCPHCKRNWKVWGVETRPVEPYVVSNPPEGYKQVLNLYVDPGTGKLIVRWEE